MAQNSFFAGSAAPITQAAQNSSYAARAFPQSSQPSLLSAMNPFGSGSVGSVTPAPTPTPRPQQPVTPQAQASSTSSSGINSPEYLAGLQNQYGSAIENAQRQIPFYQGVMGQQQQNVTNQATQQTGDENNNYQAGVNSYETQKGANTSQQRLSLAELADQIHGQNQALTNQLGTVGAGSSSALGAGQNALAHVQNTQRASIQQQTGNNNSIIGANEQQLAAQHNSNLDQIAQYKTNTLNNIVSYYTPLIQNAQTSMHQAMGEEQRLAATYNLNAVTQQATSALGSLDSSVKALTQQSLDSLSAPENLSKETVAAAPQAVGVQSVSPFNVGSTGASNTTAAPTGGSLSALMKQYQ